MDQQTYLSLIRDAVPASPGAWADLGSGSGGFTVALASLIGPGIVYSIDQDRRALDQQRRTLRSAGLETQVRIIEADFRAPLDLPQLAGVLMANSLHFHADQFELMQALANQIRSRGSLVIVEYELDRANTWVPHPLPFARWLELTVALGWRDARRVATAPSRFHGAFYCAVATMP
jgi:precorrin-6B methylase 2